jgi:hypothetical protein
MSDEYEEQEQQEEVSPEWKFRRQLPIQERMAEVVRLTIKATRSQIEAERKRLRKLQYGS